MMDNIASKTWMAAAVAALLVSATLTARAADDLATLKQEVEDLKQQVQQAGEWRQTDSSVHLAGYGAATYVDPEEGDGAFTQALFAPVFHYQYKDLLMLESELEIETSEEGESEFAMEYIALDLFLNDYVTLVTGRFLSPIGQFRQNLHPSWVNKLPTHPPGFGEEDGAAPVSDVGVELRGGFPLGGARGNYALYVANGPELHADAGELEAIEAEGRTRDVDGKKVIGGRLGILPLPHLEIGLSAAAGKATVTEDAGVEVDDDPLRNYTVLDADFAWQLGGFEARGEYVRSKVDEAGGSVAPEEATWKSWYTQVAYHLLPSGWEVVLRYTKFDAPEAALDQKQTAFGINYVFASNVIAKLAFEKNEGESGAESDNDRLLAQMAYGF